MQNRSESLVTSYLKGKSKEEVEDEEQLQLALAISQSEAEAKAEEKKRRQTFMSLDATPPGQESSVSVVSLLTITLVMWLLLLKFVEK